MCRSKAGKFERTRNARILVAPRPRGAIDGERKKRHHPGPGYSDRGILAIAARTLYTNVRTIRVVSSPPPFTGQYASGPERRAALKKEKTFGRVIIPRICEYPVSTEIKKNAKTDARPA